MDEYFDDFLEEFGEPTSRKTVDPVYAETYRGKLPDQLIQYWLEYGFCGFKEGLFWIVDPAEYDGSMNVWISDTDIVEKDTYYVIARNGFGDLYLWGTKTGDLYEISPMNGWVLEGEGCESAISKGKVDFELQIYFSCKTTDEVDIEDSKGSLFEKAVKILGPLKSDEVFGFEPSLFLGGAKAVNNIKKLNIHVHLSILAQMGHREILDRNGLMAKAFGGE